jgi:hypothetical protein
MIKINMPDAAGTIPPKTFPETIKTLDKCIENEWM